MKIRINGIKNFSFTVFFSLVAVISPSNPVNADVLTNLYELEVPVEGQGREERKYIVREALKEILVKISGKQEAAAIAEDELLVPRPTLLVQQFRYRKFKQNEVIPETPEGAKPYTKKLWLRFTKKAIAKLLRKQGLPVWGKTRPVTLVWLVVDDQKQRILIGNNTPHISRALIEEEAAKRGLPLRLPLLDLADKSKLQVTDVWGNFEDTILDASQRYQSDAILVGRIYLSYAKTWNTRWSLYSAGQRHDWDVSNSDSLRSAVKEGLSQTGEALSTRFTQTKAFTDNNMVLLKVNNVLNLKAYNKVIKYLKGLNVVTNIQVARVNEKDVVFNINSRSGRLGVIQAVSLGHMLVEDMIKPTVKSEKVESEDESLKVDLIYKWVP